MQSNPIPPIVRTLAVIAAFLPLSTSLSAQVGGGSETLFRFDGVAQHNLYSGDSSGAGDVNSDGFADIIVGAPESMLGGFISGGTATVYSGADGSVLFQWHGSAYYELFGCSVSGAGDVNSDGFADVIVGSFGYAPQGLPWLGAAYVYSGATGLLLHQFVGSAWYEQFGRAVSGAGDVNADGFADIIVGARAAAPGGVTGAGSAYVFSGSNGSLLYQWDGADSNFGLGYAVAAAGDINLDGHADLLVGAPGAYSLSTLSAGSASLYSGINGALLHQWFGNDVGSNFGSALAPAGDLNGDGYGDVFVGADRTPLGSLVHVGAIFAFSGHSGFPLFEVHGSSRVEYFGRSVASISDMNGDGAPEFMVGAVGATVGATPKEGAATLFSGADGVPVFQWHGSTAFEGFGESVNNAGDTNGDGKMDVLVSSPWAALGGATRVGYVDALSFEPYMATSAGSISATTGGSIQLDLEFPTLAAADAFKILISATGTGPTNYGVDIPLTQDRLVNQTFWGIYPFATYSNLHGILDATGDAAASVTLGAGLPSGLIGRTFWIAAVANQPGQLPEYSSIAIPIVISF